MQDPLCGELFATNSPARKMPNPIAKKMRTTGIRGPASPELCRCFGDDGGGGGGGGGDVSLCSAASPFSSERMDCACDEATSWDRSCHLHTPTHDTNTYLPTRSFGEQWQPQEGVNAASPTDAWASADKGWEAPPFKLK
eukprot:5040183-Pleurochrysis_carterae.AAC.2